MEKLVLLRRKETKESTRGVLLGPSGMQLHTLELPYRNNEFRVSCIPVGTYLCVWHLSPKFGWTYLLQGTEPRTHILFHAGNYAKDTWGCILLGKTFEEDRVWNSRQAMQEFFTVMQQEAFKLEIINFFE